MARPLLSCDFSVINRPLCEGLARETASKTPRQLRLEAHEAVFALQTKQ